MAAEMWYYTCEGKQMDPVSIKELKRLVGDGTLKPTDMVWKDGMPRWIRASSLKELFPDPTSALDQFFTSTKDAERKAQLAGAPPTPTGNNGPAVPTTTSTKAANAPAADTPKTKPKSAGDDDNDGKPPRRRAEAKSAGGGNLGIILMMLVSALVLVTCLFGMVIGAVFLFKPSGDSKKSIAEEKKDKLPPIDGDVKYDVQLTTGQKNKKSFGFKNGVSYDVRVLIEQPADPNARAPVVIYHSSGAIEASFGNPKSRNSVSRWTPKQDGDYTVEIENKTAGDMKATITVRETNAPEVKGGDPLPEGVLEARGKLTTEMIKPGKDAVFRFRVKGGYEATFNATCLPAKAGSDPAKAGSDINIQVTHETNVNEIYASDMRPDPNANVRFTRPDTEIIRLRVVNAGKTSNKATIIFNVSP